MNNTQYGIEAASNGWAVRKFVNNTQSFYVFDTAETMIDFLNSDLVPSDTTETVTNG